MGACSETIVGTGSLGSLQRLAQEGPFPAWGGWWEGWLARASSQGVTTACCTVRGVFAVDSWPVYKRGYLTSYPHIAK